MKPLQDELFESRVMPRLGKKRRGVTDMCSSIIDDVEYLFAGTRHGTIYGRKMVRIIVEVFKPIFIISKELYKPSESIFVSTTQSYQDLSVVKQVVI